MAFAARTEADGPWQAYRWNVETGAVSPASTTGSVGSVEISGDGRKVAYTAAGHAYLKTMATGALEQIDQSPSGETGNMDDVLLGGVSNDGRYVSFTSGATNLAAGTEECETIEGGCVFRRDTAQDSSIVAGVLPNGTFDDGLYLSTISADGDVVVFADGQAYARDLTSGSTKRVTQNAAGAAANAAADTLSVDADGSHVVFSSSASNLGAGGIKQRVWLTASGL